MATKRWRVDMSGWQYLLLDLNELPVGAAEIDALNQAGKNGWELVAVTSRKMAYFKRRTPQSAD